MFALNASIDAIANRARMLRIGRLALFPRENDSMVALRRGSRQRSGGGEGWADWDGRVIRACNGLPGRFRCPPDQCRFGVRSGCATALHCSGDGKNDEDR
jgi:hypothetical protein